MHSYMHINQMIKILLNKIYHHISTLFQSFKVCYIGFKTKLKVAKAHICLMLNPRVTYINISALEDT